MQIKKILLSVFVVIALLGKYNKLNAQNYIYKGDNKYLSTSSWRFISNSHNNLHTDPVITIAKREKGGYVMLSVNTPMTSYQVKGTLFIYLIDGSIIKCFDKGVRDYVDGKSISLYNLTFSEIDKLKNSRISKIRYSMSGYQEITSYTAENKINNYYALNRSKSLGYHETDKEVNELFGNTKADCDKCKTLTKDNILIKQCSVLPVAVDNLMQIGVSVGSVNKKKHIAFTIRFRGEGMEMQGNATLTLESGEMIELEFTKSRLAYIGNSYTSETLFKLTDIQANKLKESKISIIHFSLTDGITRTYKVELNNDVLLNSLKCL